MLAHEILSATGIGCIATTHENARQMPKFYVSIQYAPRLPRDYTATPAVVRNFADQKYALRTDHALRAYMYSTLGIEHTHAHSMAPVPLNIVPFSD